MTVRRNFQSTARFLQILQSAAASHCRDKSILNEYRPIFDNSQVVKSRAAAYTTWPTQR